MSRRSFAVAFFSAALAWFFAKALGVPVWNAGWSLDTIGDRSDITATVFVLALLIQGKKP